MTAFDGFLWVVLLGSLGAIVVIIRRKAPQLSIVDPMSSKEARTREKKNAPFEERMMGRVEETGRNFWKTSSSAIAKHIQEGFQRLAGKLTALERRYVEHQKTGKIDAAELHRMTGEAKKSIALGKYEPAEQELVAVLSHDPKNVEAYETLGRMYLSQGQYAEAKEALEFLVKLAPKDASVLAALGEVFEAENDMRTAYGFYEKAKTISPNNPKYLDFFIGAAIETGEMAEAKKSLDHLREVNPDNQKIGDFEEMIAEKK